MWDGGKGMAPHSAGAPYYSVLYYSLSSALAGWPFVIFTLRHLSPPGSPRRLCSLRAALMGPSGTAKDATQGATGMSLTPAPSATALSPLGARVPSVPLVPGPELRGPEAARVAELGVPDRGPLLTGSLPTARRPQRRAAGGHALPSMDMGSRMPNCLSTAMNSRTTTAMAHSSMPWMPMAALALPPRRGAGAARRLLGRPRLTCPRQAGPRGSAGPRPRAGRRR